jgi:hypothetical protein
MLRKRPKILPFLSVSNRKSGLSKELHAKQHRKISLLPSPRPMNVAARAVVRDVENENRLRPDSSDRGATVQDSDG